MLMKANRSSAISLLRILATVAVVVSHALSTLTENPDLFSIREVEKIIFEIGYSLLKWAVPVFFMITGSLMLRLDKKVTLRECIEKYAKRMLLALVVFGIPFAILIIIFERQTDWMYILPEVFIRLINGDGFSHLWYLYTMIGIYLALPVIKLFVANTSRQILEYTLIVMLIFNFCIPLVNSLTELDIAFNYLLDSYPLFYLLLGYYVSHEQPKWMCKRWLMILGIVVSSTVIVLTGCIGGNLNVVMSYNSPVAVVLSASIFVLVINSNIYQPSERLWKLDRLCFGTYLIHPLFIQFVYKFMNLTPLGTPFYLVLTMIYAIGFVVAGFAAAWVMSQIKPLKKYVL